MDTVTAAVTLFLIMDPLGNAPIFLSVLRHVPATRRRWVIARELLFALVILLFFLFFGQLFLDLLDLQQESISMAGGIVLFLIALRMIFPTKGGLIGDSPEAEPFIVPLAVPMIAGPSTVATLLLLVRTAPERLWYWFAALLVAWTLAVAILLFSNVIYRVLRERGLAALERLMGMLLVVIAVQMFLNGLREFLAL